MNIYIFVESGFGVFKNNKKPAVGLIEYHVDKVRIRQLIIGIRRKIVLFKVVESLQKGATYITNIYIYILVSQFVPVQLVISTLEI